MPAATAPSLDPALRAEHDSLAARLAVRASVDHVRRGAWALYGVAIAGGLAGKLAYDRWGPLHPLTFRGPPVFFWLALAAALACVAVAAASFARGRKLMQEEAAGFARLRELRSLLGIDP